MTDIFVSYSSPDRERVVPLVEALEGVGWSVWWDREIGPGATFDREIERALDEAACVVVAWSKSAVDSEWVRAEAYDALDRKILVPVSLDGVRPPLAFRRLQTIALEAETALDQVKRAIGALVPVRGPDTSADLRSARAAFEHHEWESAYQLLAAADEQQTLAAEDLERRAWAAYWSARYAETFAALERAEGAFRVLGERRGVARAMLHQAQFHSDQRHFAVAEGLTRSAAQLLAEEPECAEQGLLMCKLAHFFLNQGDLGRGRHYAERARDIGRRVRDRNIEAMGLLWLGHCDLSEGQLVEGMALHDEATAAATSGELDPYFSGYIYCNVINACRDRADWHRAVEWTERADRWCERESVGFFPGVCRVHRAEILRLRGSLGDAERDVMSGCEMLATASPSHSVMAFRELAEVRLRLGDLDGAEAACKSALLFGVEPQPAYARLRLERGDTDGALTSIDNALASQSIGYVQSHVHLLPTKISIAIAAGELAAARAALAQLDALAKALGTPAPAAAAASSNGELALAEDKSAVAINHLRRAVIGWVEEGVPYEAAQTRCLLATAYKREGDLEAAARELETALTSFLRLGARLDASRAQQQLTELSTPTSGGSRA